MPCRALGGHRLNVPEEARVDLCRRIAATRWPERETVDDFSQVAEDACDLVLPSMLGHSFSEKPKTTSWGPDRIARAWDVLMKRLGYTLYVSQGGDWGAVISAVMARQALPGLLSIHVNRLDRSATIPPEAAALL